VNSNQTRDMLLADLGTQSNDATRGHAEAARDLTPAERVAIVDFEMSLATAQLSDKQAAGLDTGGATGGPVPLLDEVTYFGINDVLGGDPSGAPFNPLVFRNFDAWAAARGSNAAARQSVARGQAIFNSRSFQISGVRGVNDALGVPSLTGTCTTCHDTPNAGNHSTRLPLDLGLTDASRRTPDMPLYTLRNKANGAIIQTTDPGRALITGKWKDVALFKGAILRALASRPPYFHNGSAATLLDVVDFYNSRFAIGLTPAERADLAAFLRVL
jgi:cytochrome c peroxidase